MLFRKALQNSNCLFPFDSLSLPLPEHHPDVCFMRMCTTSNIARLRPLLEDLIMDTTPIIRVTSHGLTPVLIPTPSRSETPPHITFRERVAMRIREYEDRRKLILDQFKFKMVLKNELQRKIEQTWRRDDANEHIQEIYEMQYLLLTHITRATELGRRYEELDMLIEEEYARFWAHRQME